MLRLIRKRRKLEIKVGHKNKLEFLKVLFSRCSPMRNRCFRTISPSGQLACSQKSLSTLLQELRTGAIKSRCFIKYQDSSKWLLKQIISRYSWRFRQMIRKEKFQEKHQLLEVLLLNIRTKINTRAINHAMEIFT